MFLLKTATEHEHSGKKNIKRRKVHVSGGGKRMRACSSKKKDNVKKICEEKSFHVVNVSVLCDEVIQMRL